MDQMALSVPPAHAASRALDTSPSIHRFISGPPSHCVPSMESAPSGRALSAKTPESAGVPLGLHASRTETRAPSCLLRAATDSLSTLPLEGDPGFSPEVAHPVRVNSVTNTL